MDWWQKPRGARALLWKWRAWRRRCNIGKTARYWDAVRELAMNAAVILCLAAAAVAIAAVCALIIRS